MKTAGGALRSASLLAALALLCAGGCTHFWERSGGNVADFERESAACIGDAKESGFGPDGMQEIYRACMRARGWKRVEASVGEDNQFRGPESSKDFNNPPPAMGGRRYLQR